MGSETQIHYIKPPVDELEPPLDSFPNVGESLVEGTSFETRETSQMPELGSAEASDITTVFLGLRKIILERRMERSADKIDKLETTGSVASHIGESLLKGKGYEAPDHLWRPVTRPEHRIARRLERKIEKERKTMSHVNHLKRSNSYKSKEPDQKRIYDLGTREFNGRVKEQRTSRRERRLYGRRDRNVKKWTGQAERKTASFNNIINKPAEKQQKYHDKIKALHTRKEIILSAQQDKHFSKQPLSYGSTIDRNEQEQFSTLQDHINYLSKIINEEEVRYAKRFRKS